MMSNILLLLRSVLLYIGGGIYATARWLWSRRTWWLPKIMSLLLIVILLATLCLAFLRLWGKTMAEYSESCFITKVYNSVRENECAQKAVKELREDEFWKGIKQALYSSSNDSLEPVENILGLLGIVSIFLSTINEVLSTRSKGILLNEVANHFFPMHWLFQIILYACFALMGVYAAKKGIVMTVALCLLGLGICFVYSLIMAFVLVFYHKARNLCVEEYFLYTLRLPLAMEWPLKCYSLPRMRKRAEKAQKKFVCEWKNRAQLNVMDFAEYVGQQHCRNARFMMGSQTLEYRLVDGVRRWLNVEPSRENGNQQDLALSSVFEKVFDCGNVENTERAMYVLYTKCLPEAEDETIKNYKQNVVRSSLVWERLLDGIQDNQRKARMAYFVLVEAKSQDNRTFTNLSGGLLHWLRLADCGIASRDLEHNLEEKINFLLQIRQAALEDSVTNKKVEPFLKAWSELMCVAMLILGCMEYLRPELTRYYGKCKQFAKEYISANIQSPIRYRDEKYCAVYAYLIFSIENYDVCKAGSVYVLDCVRNTISEDLKL